MSSSQCHQALPGRLAVLRETDTCAASHVLTKGSCRGPAHSGSSALGDLASPTVDKVLPQGEGVQAETGDGRTTLL